MPRAAVGVSVVLVLSLAASARQEPPQFTAATDLVRVDVSVLDRDRRPVRGLTAGEFTLTEDGRAQPIVAFSEIALPEPDEAGAAWTRESFPDIRRNDDPSDHRLVVLVLDDALIPQHVPAMVASTKEIARGVVERLGPRDLAAVVFTQDSRRAQTFTNERARLMAAVDAFTGGFHEPLNLLGPPQVAHAENARALGVTGLLRQLVGALASIPDRRKALIYVGIGAPVDVDTVVPFADPADPTPQVVAELREVFRLAARANVNMYGVDPGGLDGVRSYLDRDVRSRFPFELEQLRQKAEASSRAYRDFLRAMADNTGGHAFINTNEFTTGVTQILRETGTFYLLGYRPPNPKADGRLRRIEVRVDRRGLTVSARRGYYAPDPPRAGTRLPPPPTVEAIAGLLPKSDLPLRVAAAPFALPGERDAAVVVALGLRAPTDRAGAGIDRVNLLVSAYTTEGEARASEALVAEVTVGPGERAADADWEVFGRLRLPPGRYELRVAADSALVGRSGSVHYDLEVPDFRAQPLSLSGIVLGVEPAVPAAPRDRFADLLPLVPTVRRAFAVTDIVQGFVRLHEGGTGPLAPATVTVRIVDGADRTVFDLPRTFGSDQFTPARSIDYLFDVPVARLSPGPHLLRLDARSGRTAAGRDVPFTVR